MAKYVLYLSVLFFSSAVSANGWSWNLGYHNPPGSVLGLNFLYAWTNWAFEAGIGGVEQNKGVDPATGEETKSVSVLGDVNVKYLFNGRTVRPYIQLGSASSATITTNSGSSASAGIGGNFYGAGIFLIGQPFYVYFSLNGSSGTSSNFFQAGLGFHF